MIVGPNYYQWAVYQYKISRVDLAEKLGVSKKILGGMLSGKRALTSDQRSVINRCIDSAKLKTGEK